MGSSLKVMIFRNFRLLTLELQQFILRHDCFTRLILRIIPARLTAELIGLVGRDYARLGSDRTEVIRHYSEAANTLLGVSRMTEPPSDVHIGPGRQLLIDITALGGRDPRTGIQRVVRSLLQRMNELPENYHIFCVYHWDEIYRHASLKGEPIQIRPGDVFVGLDLDLYMDDASRKWLEQQSRYGLKTYFIVYDILPLLRPDWFPPYYRFLFERWLKGIARISNGLICISRSTAEQLIRLLEEHFVERQAPLEIGYFHLGSDIEASLPSTGISSEVQKIIKLINSGTSILMVGTLEPRKGYSQALKAFNILWDSGHDIKLVIVGKEGWSVNKIVRRLRKHPEIGKRLFWLDSASDELLLKLYSSCSAFLMASEGEGFGLPIVEAARHGLPVIARDIPVFKEIAGEHAFYFDGMNAGDLANAIDRWLELHRKGEHPRPEGMQRLTWEESARQLKQVVFGSQWWMEYRGPKI